LVRYKFSEVILMFQDVGHFRHAIQYPWGCMWLYWLLTTHWIYKRWWTVDFSKREEYQLQPAKNVILPVKSKIKTIVTNEGFWKIDTVYAGRHLRLRLVEHRSILKFCSDIRFFHFIWDTAFS
jgi:hypothetical protein